MYQVTSSTVQQSTEIYAQTMNESSQQSTVSPSEVSCCKCCCSKRNQYNSFISPTSAAGDMANSLLPIQPQLPGPGTLSAIENTQVFESPNLQLYHGIFGQPAEPVPTVASGQQSHATDIFGNIIQTTMPPKTTNIFESGAENTRPLAGTTENPIILYNLSYKQINTLDADQLVAASRCPVVNDENAPKGILRDTAFAGVKYYQTKFNSFCFSNPNNKCPTTFGFGGPQKSAWEVNNRLPADKYFPTFGGGY